MIFAHSMEGFRGCNGGFYIAFCAKFHFDNALFCPASLMEQAKGCAAIAVTILVVEFLRLMDMAQGGVIKLFEYIAVDGVDIADRDDFGITAGNFISTAAGGKIELMADQYIALHFVNCFTCNEGMEGGIIGEVIAVLIRTCDAFDHGGLDEGQQVEVYRARTHR